MSGIGQVGQATLSWTSQTSQVRVGEESDKTCFQQVSYAFDKLDRLDRPDHHTRQTKPLGRYNSFCHLFQKAHHLCHFCCPCLLWELLRLCLCHPCHRGHLWKRHERSVSDVASGPQWWPSEGCTFHLSQKMKYADLLDDPKRYGWQQNNMEMQQTTQATT